MKTSRLLVMLGVLSISAAAFANGMPESKYNELQKHVRTESTRDPYLRSHQDRTQSTFSKHAVGVYRKK